jgi:hypothetical protein
MDDQVGIDDQVQKASQSGQHQSDLGAASLPERYLLPQVDLKPSKASL